MKKEVADKWIADLRSNPKQAKGRLFDGEGHCCLGRLCLIMGAEFSKSILEIGDNNIWEVVINGNHTGSTRILPDEIVQSAGLKDSTGRFIGGCLAGLNDSGYSFEYIANAIEVNWKLL